MTETDVGFRIETTSLGRGRYLLAARGELDLYTAPELKSELVRLTADGATRIVVDLRGTTFVDSTTLGVLLAAVKRLRLLDGDLALVCDDRNIRRILEITLLDRVFTLYDSVEEALDATR